MCVVSMIMDHYHEKWRDKTPTWIVPMPAISPTEIDEFRKLLDRAREYDKKHNQPDCELEEKRQKLKKLADELGVKIDFL